MQRAILKGPGWVNLVVCLNRREGVGPEDVWKAAAKLMAATADPRLPSNLTILVGLGGRGLEGHPRGHDVLRALEKVGTQSDFDLFVQVAAQTAIDLEIAQRLLDVCLGQAFQAPPAVSVLGGRILNAQEHFGFPDGTDPAWADVVAATHAQAKNSYLADSKERSPDAIGQLVANGPGTWVVFQPVLQDIKSFYKLSDEERANVVGRAPASLKNSDARLIATAAGESGGSENSHFRVMRQRKLPLLRRGFPCRFDGGPGLAFIGAAETPAVLAEALALFTEEKDALRRYVTLQANAFFYAPPSAEWLVDSASPPDLPAEIRALLHHQAPLTVYEVAESFAQYLGEMRLVAFDGPPGQMRFPASVEGLLKALHRVLADRSADPAATAARLDGLAEQAQKDANTINAAAGKYVTFS